MPEATASSTQVNNQASNQGNSWLMDFSGKHHALIALVCLALLEALCFAGIGNHVGFYLDDWTTLCTLKFGPQSLPAMMANYFFVDPKVIIRPVEVLQFALLFKLFALKPLGYHIFNGILEIASAWLLYLCLFTYNRDRTLALAAAILLLLLPLHDSTHYWVLASSCTLSLAFYLLSLYITLIARARPTYYLLAALAFAVSIFSYESFLPLCLLNCAFVLQQQESTDRKVLRNFLTVSLGYFLCIAALWVYQRVLVPHIGVGWIHDAHFDPKQIVQTVLQGVALLSPGKSIPFFAKLIASYTHAITSAQKISLIAAGLLSGVTFYIFSQREPVRIEQSQNATGLSNIGSKGESLGHAVPPRQNLSLILLGAAIILISYSIFGLNPEYTPTFSTLVNRINMGAAIGVAIIIAALFKIILNSMKDDKTAAVCGSLALGVLIVPLFLANWSMSGPWLLSWQTQQRIFKTIAEKQNTLPANDSIILANCPRYVDWAPVFDGVWDFQSLVRIVRNDSKAKGGVVSDRIHLYSDHIADISSGYICGVYPYQGMHCLFPAGQRLVPVNSASDFVALIGKNGMTFDLTKTTIKNWQTEISAFGNNKTKEAQTVSSPSLSALKTAI